MNTNVVKNFVAPWIFMDNGCEIDWYIRLLYTNGLVCSYSKPWSKGAADKPTFIYKWRKRKIVEKQEQLSVKRIGISNTVKKRGN